MGHDILIVDDERDICTLIAGILEDEGHAPRRAPNGTEAADSVRQRGRALVILDVWLQGSELDGLQLLDVIRREEPPIPVVMISGHGTIDTAVSAIKSGAYDFIEKPFKADRLLLVVDRAIEADWLRRENASLRRRAGGEGTFVGSSGAAPRVRTQIERVAPTGSRVLITGASGAGKETVARLIHQGSKRADGPFVVINCSTLPAERLELELFGTDRETDGDSLHVSGALELAHGGTLAALQGHDWPGNVRQLRNVIERLLILAPVGGGAIRADVLPNDVSEDAPSVLRWEKGGEIMQLPLRDAREVFEREYLLAQVTRFGGNISRTATFVGMERSALHRKLKSLGLHGGAPDERSEAAGS